MIRKQFLKLSNICHFSELFPQHRATSTLHDKREVDPYRNANQIPTNSGNELDPRVPLKPSLSSRGPRTWYTLFSKNSWVTIRSLLCFELEQIRDHFYYINFLFFYNKSGLRFAVTQSITMVTFYSNPAVF